MLRIRLSRTGRRNRPAYRLVVQDKKKRRDGPAIEVLGWYDPMRAERKYQFDLERVRHWLARGAQPSERVAVLLRQAGLAASG